MPATIFYSKPEVIPWAWQHDTLDSASDTDCSIRLGWCCCRGMAVTGRNYHQLCPQEPWGRESHELMELTLLFSWLCKQFLITVIKKLSKTCSKKTFACSEGYLKWKRKKNYWHILITVAEVQITSAGSCLTKMPPEGLGLTSPNPASFRSGALSEGLAISKQLCLWLLQRQTWACTLLQMPVQKLTPCRKQPFKNEYF